MFFSTSQKPQTVGCSFIIKTLYELKLETSGRAKQTVRLPSIGMIPRCQRCTSSGTFHSTSRLLSLSSIPYVPCHFQLLLFRYLRDMSYRRGVWQYGRVPLTLTFQLEVAKRLCSPIACDTRSRISIMTQYVSEPKIVFEIPGSFF